MIQFNKQEIQKLKDNGLDFNDLFILMCYYNNTLDLLNIFTIPSIEDINISTRHQYLRKNDYLVEDPEDNTNIILSTKGKNFIVGLKIEPTKEIHQSVEVTIGLKDFSTDLQFEEWWKMFPNSDSWESEDGSIKYIGSRTIKNIRKADAKKRYLKLLNQGYSHEWLLGALKFELKLKKQDSVKKNENQMAFFKGMESYFNTERYNVYVDMYKMNPAFVEGVNNIKKVRHSTDI